MAISMDNLSFSWSETPAASALRCRLLFLRRTWRVEQPQTSSHSHSWWQMELVTDGRLLVRENQRGLRLKTGDAVLIPPHTLHEFVYDDPQAGWISLSFHVEGWIETDGLHRVGKCPFLAGVTRTIQSLIDDANWPNDQVRAAIAAQLASVLSYVYTPPNENNDDRFGPLVRNVLTYARSRNGQTTSVQEVADHLGYTVNHVSAQFRSQVGESLKHFLDRQQAEKAASLLRYTNLSITQIAETLGFNDIFSFSRHFRRMTGHSPRQFRREEMR
ncbi:MAG: AraC family transcriptional regulator [Phycisphaerales bacterium]